MKIEILEPVFAICKVPDMSDVTFADDFIFAAKTDEEFSIVCASSAVPQNALQTDSGWRAFRIQGVLDFSLVGVLAEITGILAAHGISIFAVSTYNTDYILAKTENFERAIKALADNGYRE